VDLPQAKNKSIRNRIEKKRKEGENRLKEEKKLLNMSLGIRIMSFSWFSLEVGNDKLKKLENLNLLINYF